MNKKTKNIISIVIIVVLIVSMILTVYFGKDHHKIINNRNLPSFNNRQNDNQGRMMPRQENNKIDQDNYNKPNRVGTMNTISIILINAQSFLLGGTIVFIIMNNIYDIDKKYQK